MSLGLDGKAAVVFGVANKRSIAWAIAKQLHGAGMRLAITYQNERLAQEAADLIAELPGRRELPVRRLARRRDRSSICSAEREVRHPAHGGAQRGIRARRTNCAANFSRPRVKDFALPSTSAAIRWSRSRAPLLR